MLAQQAVSARLELEVLLSSPAQRAPTANGSTLKLKLNASIVRPAVTATIRACLRQVERAKKATTAVVVLKAKRQLSRHKVADAREATFALQAAQQ
jgi:hypothetical protein